MTSERSDFLTNYKTVLDAATTWGIRDVPLRTGPLQEMFVDQKHMMKFMAACHRGYDKAQTRILDLIIDLHSDLSISVEEKTYRELAYRKIIDSIAFLILKTETHVMRRLVLHDYPPHIDLNVVLEAKKSIDDLNSESRQTFAVLADLTTFIHVADILRVDYRHPSPELSLIELKTGKINKMLLSKLEEYEPTEESIKLLQVDHSIEQKYKPQAERMLKQKIRLKQITEVLKEDEGIDVITKLPIKLFDSPAEPSSYAESLEQGCYNAKNHGAAAGTIQYCIHIGVGFSEDVSKVESIARRAALAAYHTYMKDPPKGLNNVRSELLSIISEKELIKGGDPFIGNLYSVSTTPFPTWGISPEHLISLLAGNLNIVTIFDPASFIWLGRS